MKKKQKVVKKVSITYFDLEYNDNLISDITEKQIRAIDKLRHEFDYNKYCSISIYLIKLEKNYGLRAVFLKEYHKQDALVKELFWTNPYDSWQTDKFNYDKFKNIAILKPFDHESIF